MTTAAKECAVSKSDVCRVSAKFQPTDAHNWRLIHIDIFENIKLLPVSDLTGPSSGSTLFVATVIYHNNLLLVYKKVLFCTTTIMYSLVMDQ
jgi:hypothetical protein